MPIVTAKRKRLMASSNNQDNSKQNVCVINTCQQFIKVNKNMYLHNVGDLLRNMRRHYRIQEVRFARKRCYEHGRMIMFEIARQMDMGIYNPLKGFLYIVDGHVAPFDNEGHALTDTCPNSTVKKPIFRLYSVLAK